MIIKSKHTYQQKKKYVKSYPTMRINLEICQIRFNKEAADKTGQVSSSFMVLCNKMPKI